jgi:rapamycin-insensitive companion of mTOR
MVFRILEKFKVFTAFYHLTELKDRHDLMTPIIETLDYSMSVSPLNFLCVDLT